MEKRNVISLRLGTIKKLGNLLKTFWIDRGLGGRFGLESCTTRHEAEREERRRRRGRGRRRWRSVRGRAVRGHQALRRLARLPHALRRIVAAPALIMITLSL